MKYVILYLILDATTGQPLEVGRHDNIEYAVLDNCEKAKMRIGPRKPKDGRVRVFSCGGEKQVTIF